MHDVLLHDVYCLLIRSTYQLPVMKNAVSGVNAAYPDMSAAGSHISGPPFVIPMVFQDVPAAIPDQDAYKAFASDPARFVPGSYEEHHRISVFIGFEADIIPFKSLMYHLLGLILFT